MQKLARIDTAKVPATAAIAGTKVASKASNVILLDIDDTPYRRLGMLTLVLVFGIFALWATFAPLGSYAVASGKVVVQMKKQVIQHREGGVIDDIFVQDGDHVEKGQKLLLISPTEARSQQSLVYEQLLTALGVEARLNAELEAQTDIIFPVDLTDASGAFRSRAQEIMADERQLFQVRKASADSETVVLKQRIQQLEEELGGTGKQIASKRELASSYAEEVRNLQNLHARQLISKLQLDETERKRLSVNADIAELETGMASFKVKVAETKEQLVLQNNDRRKEGATKLGETRQKIADLRSQLDATADRLARTDIVAPESGTVVGLAYHTKGGVVQPGSTILEIVPKAEGFEVEAQVNTKDIDKVHVGLPADIRFPVFASASFLKVTHGEVIDVSADTFPDSVSKQSFYHARVKIAPEGVAELAKHQLTLVQGMPSEVSIKTGERTFMQYLLKPVINMVNHAFNED